MTVKWTSAKIHKKSRQNVEVWKQIFKQSNNNKNKIMMEMDQALGPSLNASFPSLGLVEIELSSGPAGLLLLLALALPSSSSGLHSTPVSTKNPTRRILLPGVAVAPFASWWPDVRQWKSQRCSIHVVLFHQVE